MKLAYCNQCTTVIAAHDLKGAISHNQYDEEGIFVATHTDFQYLDVEEPFTTDLSYLEDKYKSEFV